MLWIWLAFIAFILVLLALDLGVFHRSDHAIGVKEALSWSLIWVVVALAFGAFVYYGYRGHWLGLGTQPDAVDGNLNDGGDALVKYLTGYVIEKSLSVDNLFVIAVLFGFFQVPRIYQHRVLFWGILGALLMRGAMIAVGATLIARYHWVLYIFGGFLILTAVKMLLAKENSQSSPGDNWVVRLVRKLFPVTDHFHGHHFIVRAGTAASHEPRKPGEPVEADRAVDLAKSGRRMLTPLALSLIMVEATDAVFAVDSIPAIFAVTADPFLVFTSNVFALLGLRSLYFALAGMMKKFHYLKISLAVILALVGIKMLAANWLKSILGHHFNFYLLGAVMAILAAGVLASIARDRQRLVPSPGTPGEG
jgi:tellurite resistance protein TerC